MRIPSILITLLGLAACSGDSATTQFATEPTVTPVPPGMIDEASGIADSRSIPGTLWIEQDSGNPANVDLIGYDGQLKGRIAIPTATNRDWEDLASGPGPQAAATYLYIADIGDNNAVNQTSYIYRLPEPVRPDAAVMPASVEKISFQYPDGPRDAECLLVDPQTKDLWIVTKRESKVHLYQLPYPQATTGVIMAKSYGELPLSGVTGGSMSSDGSEILIRSYTNVYYFKRSSGQSIADALQRQTAVTLPYRVEPQGEAVCFGKANNGYFTISERASAASVNLYYYTRQ